METILLFSLIGVFLYGSLVNATWCDLDTCQAEHIDCTMGDGSFGLDCPDSAMMLDLRNAQTKILDRLNGHRNKVAGGGVTNLEPAARMAKLQWNTPLANLCRRNVKQCANPGVAYDGCRNTNNFDYAGQNLAYAKFPQSKTHNNLDIILSLIDYWFSMCEKASAEDLAVFPGTTADGDVIAPCTQLLKYNADRVGCGAMRMYDGDDKIIHVCCNFNQANILDWPIYDAGEPGSKCTTGKDSTHKNLCSTSESFKVNNFWEDYE